MKYSYFITYVYTRENDLMGLFGFGGSGLSLSNAIINCSNKIENWTTQDFNDVKEKIAEDLSKEIDGLDGKKIKIEYKKENIILLNMMEKKYEEIRKETE